eukprot:m.170197 g.170197  ORF g.170197 m.170197 type:complete len:319 (+) comp21218_c1_seq1:1568-2524(+)
MSSSRWVQTRLLTRMVSQPRRAAVTASAYQAWMFSGSHCTAHTRLSRSTKRALPRCCTESMVLSSWARWMYARDSRRLMACISSCSTFSSVSPPRSSGVAASCAAGALAFFFFLLLLVLVLVLRKRRGQVSSQSFGPLELHRDNTMELEGAKEGMIPNVLYGLSEDGTAYADPRAFSTQEPAVYAEPEPPTYAELDTVEDFGFGTQQGLVPTDTVTYEAQQPPRRGKLYEPTSGEGSAAPVVLSGGNQGNGATYEVQQAPRRGKLYEPVPTAGAASVGSVVLAARRAQDVPAQIRSEIPDFDFDDSFPTGYIRVEAEE